ncbi:hypothetical protein N9R95_00250 [Flavobacteriaceae bacterium]|nr:hypothetical protein [Flavobacteriaceae bacterium]
MDTVKNKISNGIHIGTSVQLEPVGVELRYEKGFSTVEIQLFPKQG